MYKAITRKEQIQPGQLPEAACRYCVNAEMLAHLTPHHTQFGISGHAQWCDQLKPDTLGLDADPPQLGGSGTRQVRGSTMTHGDENPCCLPPSMTKTTQTQQA